MASNPADKYAKKTFGQLESQMSRMYREAYKDISQKMNDFTRRHKAKDKQMQRDLKKGKITQEQYAQWMRGQVFIGQQWQDAKASINACIKNVMTSTASLTHQKSIDVFVDNANYTAFQIERDHGFIGGINFEMYDRKTISRLTLEDPELLPRKRDINGNKLDAWNTKTISNCVSQAILQGESIDELSKRIARDTCMQAGRSSLLYARTAMTAAQNAGRVERMVEAEGMGIKVQKQWMSTLDSRTRDTHRDMDGEIADVNEEFSNGLEYPGDPGGDDREVYNCRCTLIYHYPEYSDYSKMERTAYYEEGDPEYDPDHRNYETVKGMNYEQWTNYKQDQIRQRYGGGSTPVPATGGASKTSKPTSTTSTSKKKQKTEEELALERRQKNIEKIMKSHTVDQMTPEQKQEFTEILGGMSDDMVELYSHMVKLHKDNQYKDKGTGWYAPYEKRVRMDLDSNNWEKKMGRTGSTGSWKTKFHEELHQLDHVLGMARGGSAFSDATRCEGGVWNPPTAMGTKLRKATENDVMSLWRKAIDKYNKDLGLTGKSAIKYITDISKPISRDAKYALVNYLEDIASRDHKPGMTNMESYRASSRIKAMMSPLTDAIGLLTGGRVDPHAEGFWGHDANYDKQMGINGMTSEVWAELGSHIMRGDTEVLTFLQEVMPESSVAYREELDEALKFIRDNPGLLKYPKH